jgi:hypothetical protein
LLWVGPGRPWPGAARWGDTHSPDWLGTGSARTADAPDTDGLIGGMFVLDPSQKHPGVDDPLN